MSDHSVNESEAMKTVQSHLMQIDSFPLFLSMQGFHIVIQAAIDKGFGDTDYSAIYEGINP